MVKLLMTPVSVWYEAFSESPPAAFGNGRRGANPTLVFWFTIVYDQFDVPDGSLNVTFVPPQFFQCFISPTTLGVRDYFE